MFVFTPNTLIRSSEINANFAEITDAWTPWTPTWGGVNMAKATSTGYYKKVGKTVHFRAKLVITNSTAPITGRIDLNFPFAARESGLFQVQGWIHQPSVNYWPLFGLQNGTAGAMCMVGLATSTYTQWAGTASNVPMVWANTHELYINGTYEAA